MEKSELLKNLKRTNKIVEYAIQQKIGKGYKVKLNIADEDYDKEGIVSIMYVIDIVKPDPDSHIEINEISDELKEQSDVIENVLINSKSSIGKDGSFGPNNGGNRLLGPSINGLEYNPDVFEVQWIFEYSID